MAYVVYRGDNRPPADIRQASGFQPWNPQPPALLLRLLRRCLIDADTCSPGLAVGDITPLHDEPGYRRAQAFWDFLKNHVRAVDAQPPQPALFTLGDLYQKIRKETDRDSLHISTETSAGGGGMGGRYVYRIECPQPLYLLPSRLLGAAPMLEPPQAAPPELLEIPRSVRPRLLTSADGNGSVDSALHQSAAGLIAILNVADTAEVAFLTPIPFGWITGYLDTQATNGEAQWHAMPTA